MVNHGQVESHGLVTRRATRVPKAVTADRGYGETESHGLVTRRATRVPRRSRLTAVMARLNRPGFLGGSIPLKGRWSHANREESREAVHAALHPG